MNIPEEVRDFLNTLAFRGNTSIRPEGAVIEYTQDMFNEYEKCKNDPIYFIETYCKVIHVDKGLVPFILHEYQKRMISAYHSNRFVCTMASRQLGKTVCVAAYFCWYIIFNDEKTGVILANKAAVSREILDRVKIMYSNLPKYIQQGVTSWNKGSIELENKSRIFCGATSSTGYRGFAIGICYLDEYSFVPTNVAEEFYTSMFPTLSSGVETKMIVSSTPNGINHFHKMWNDAEKGKSIFVPIKCMWYEHPDRDQKWADEQLLALGELKYNQEVTCAFLGSSRTLFRSDTLSNLSYDDPIKIYDDQFKGLNIYTMPIKNRIYSMAVDVSRGRHLDYSTFSIFDITEYPHTVAATYRNNEISPMLYASIIQNIGLRYNTAYLLIEINDIGGQVADTLWNELEYPEMFWSKSGDILGKTGADPYPGIRTTKKTKRVGCANLKDMVENHQLIINDFHTISELSTFIQNNIGSYEADIGFNDDMVATLWLHAWLVSQGFFVELTDKNLRLEMHSNHIKEMEDQVCLPCFFSDGNDFYDTTQGYPSNDF